MAVRNLANRSAGYKPSVVKQASNKLPPGMAMKLAGFGVILALGALAVFGMKSKEIIAQCSERYGTGTLFGLQDKAGAPIATADLQGRLAGRDWGLLENLKLVALKDGPAEVAMQIALPKVAPKPDDEVQPRSGMGFTWLVPRMANARAACLSYSIWLPDDFNFGGGGVLPGLFGGETSEAPSQAQKGAFSVRSTWGEGGIARVRTITAAEPKGTAFAIDPKEELEWPRGRWVRIEQELVLNQVSAEDGILRVWVNGKLYHENTGLNVRADDRPQFRGVVADVHYGINPQGPYTVPKPTSLRVTPFELRWQ